MADGKASRRRAARMACSTSDGGAAATPWASLVGNREPAARHGGWRLSGWLWRGFSDEGARQACRDAATTSSAESRAGELGLEHGAGRMPDEVQGVGCSTVSEAEERRLGG